MADAPVHGDSTSMAAAVTASEPAAAPVTSGPDAALASWRNTDPAKAPDAAPLTNADPTVPAVGDLEQLVAAVEEPKVDDPLEALKDNPRVQELVAAETALKSYQEVIASLPYKVDNPQELGAQLKDAQSMYDVVLGKAPASQLLDTMLQNPDWTPQQKQAVLTDLAQAIAKATGQPIAANAAGVVDPLKAELDQIKNQMAEQKRAEENGKLEQRASAAKTKVSENIAAFLKDKAPEAFAGTYLKEVGNVLKGKEMDLIAAVEKGDYSMLDKAVRQVHNARVAEFKEWAKYVIAAKTQKNAAIPKQVSGGQPVGTLEPKLDLTDQKTRLDHNLAQWRGQSN